MKKTTLMTFALSLIILTLDQWTKYLVHTNIPRMQLFPWYPYQGIGLFENVLGIEASIVHAINRGAAWGVLADYQIPLLILRICFVIGLISYVVFINDNSKRIIPLVLISTGALGNILDFFFYGHVVDMIHFVFWGYDYPVFNLADSAIFIGVFWLLGVSWYKPKQHDTRNPSPFTGR